MSKKSRSKLKSEILPKIVFSSSSVSFERKKKGKLGKTRNRRPIVRRLSSLVPQSTSTRKEEESFYHPSAKKEDPSNGEETSDDTRKAASLTFPFLRAT